MHPREIQVALKRRLSLNTAEVKWQTDSPKSHGINAAKLDLLRDDLASRKTNAFLVVRKNRIVYEWYSANYGPNIPHYSASSAKALVGGSVLLIALTDGRLGIDDPAWMYIPDWKNDAQKHEITIRHLATHSSGLQGVMDFDENRGNLFPLALDETTVASHPGSRLAYSNAGVVALAYAITASLKDSPQKTIRDVLKKRIMEPLEVPDKAWEISYGEAYRQDGLKLYLIGGGGVFTARAAGRIGQLMLQRGKWQGRQLIETSLAISAQTNACSVETKCPPTHPAPGLGWWSNSNGACPSLPPDAFAAAGFGHQIVLVVPSLDLVVVRFGSWLDSSMNSMGGQFWSDAEKYLFQPLMNVFDDGQS